MTAPEIIADFPAYTIVKPVSRRSFALDVTRPTFCAGDVIGIPIQSWSHGELYHFFRFGSVASYALEYGECPIKAYNWLVENGHQTHWLNAEAVMITAKAREKETRAGLNFGDEVIFEGRLFRIDPAPNNNAKLTEITI